MFVFVQKQKKKTNADAEILMNWVLKVKIIYNTNAYTYWLHFQSIAYFDSILF